MVAQIDYLLPDDPDAAELIAQLIGTIIKEESENQVALAIADGATPAEAAAIYELGVYVERWAPWDIWVNAIEGQTIPPVVNVWIETQNQDESASNQMSRQTYQGTWNIDVYGYGTARPDPTDDTRQIAADAGPPGQPVAASRGSARRTPRRSGLDARL